MSKHAFLSPSSSHRWLNCTPSASLESEFENKTSQAAEEGTAAHAWCEHKLKKAFRRRSKRPVSSYDSDEMQEHTDAYVDFVLEQFDIAKQSCKDSLVLIEQHVDFSEYVPDGYGTADCVIVSDDKLHIIDFKYGMGVLVDATDNPQMKCYALGALAIYDSTVDKVTFSDFLKDNILAFFVTAGFFVFSIISIILVLLRKARKAEAAAKLAANDTQKLNDKLEIALKKAEDASLAKTRFLNNMSHDIRTPMNVILGHAQLMENELKGKGMPEMLEHLEKLQQSGNLLLAIINNVLDMAKIESGRMELDENYCRIEAVWKSLFAVFDEKARKKNIALHYTMNVEHEHVLTDVTKVKEILVNILSNSIKYTPVGGSVMVDVDELSCDESGYMIERIRVSDTGIGMSQDYLKKIFEAFTREKNTTKSKIAGTGLGMSIVKKYVDLLGGTINVESELGKGSTFTVTLKHRIADESYYEKNIWESLEQEVKSSKAGISFWRRIMI